ncbi:hypothetical protein [Halobacillus mangrovi]|uniref:Uncharacterized protein n=1 Tax=Halobacillus mangrovi TaxID=402384 RepID=A0A1W5ZYD0_9BACI|nr:hypothetical protein [Halobacillus mangrovi]ARI78237.1 hypothetical protein HM131_15870 [Halobacillus mangrovi]
MPKKTDLTRQKFGRLTVIEESGRAEGSGHIKWLCKCDCGNETSVRADHLRSNHTKSCGCKRRPHGMRCTRFYRIWTCMKQRATNENAQNYNDYGGRGIILCPRWRKFENFRDDMYESYVKHVDQHGESNTSIERMNNDKRYTPWNCRFATWEEQANNRRPRTTEVEEA